MMNNLALLLAVLFLLLSLFGWLILRLAKEIRVRKQAEEELSRYREQLEDMVRERSKALAESDSLLNSLFEDITNLKHAEEQLKAREESYRCFAELTSDYVHKCTRTGCEPFRIQWMGGAIGAISGYTMEEVFKLGSWLPLVHPDDRQMMSSHLSNPVPGEVK